MSFSEFYQRSINEPEQFWAEQARRIDWQTPFTQTLDHSNPPFARWFCEGRTNLCHNAIDRWLEKQLEALALIDCRLFGNRRRAHLYLSPAA